MKLVIIGNGFDRAHDLPTSYSNFKDYLQKEDSDEYEFLSILFGQEFEKDDFWKKFENCLSKYDFCNFSKNQKYDQIIRCSDNDEIDKSFYKEIHKLKEYFCKWIKSINMPKCKKDNIENYLNDSLILSFNYTNTVEVLYSIKNVYHIHGSINDINNNLLDRIILGHRNNYPHDEVNMILDDSIVDDTKNKESLSLNLKIGTIDNETLDLSNADIPLAQVCNCYKEERFNKILDEAAIVFDTLYFKRVNDVIREDCSGFFKEINAKASEITEIYILGHGLGDCDKEYYRKIIEILDSKGNFKNITWNITHYNDGTKDNLDDLKKELEKIDSRIIKPNPIKI